LSPSAFLLLPSFGPFTKYVVPPWTGGEEVMPPRSDCPAEEASAFDTGQIQALLC